jgi:hypothetical protein
MCSASPGRRMGSTRHRSSLPSASAPAPEPAAAAGTAESERTRRMRKGMERLDALRSFSCGHSIVACLMQRKRKRRRRRRRGSCVDVARTGRWRAA